jgi:hypothetical protein
LVEFWGSRRDNSKSATIHYMQYKEGRKVEEQDCRRNLQMMCSSRHWFVATAAAGLQEEGQGRRLLCRCPPAVPPPAGVQEEGQGRRGSGAVQEKGEAEGCKRGDVQRPEETCRGQRASVWRLG